jgi:hypothetical protein
MNKNLTLLRQTMDNLKKVWVFSVMAFLAISCKGSEMAVAQPGSRVAVETFYDELAPYGRWIADPVYGYVWVPDVEPGFQPYATRGNWVMTQYGNMWVSDYAWGWAPFHYGRWAYDAFHGWLWVPGSEWGPAWVAWRSGGGYYGWAPLEPGMHVNVGMHVPLRHWMFVPYRYITSPRLYHYYVPAPRVTNIYHHTTVINNYYTQGNRTYVYGPREQEIEQHTRRRVPVYQVNDGARPGRAVVRNGAVNIYRPEVGAGRTADRARISPRENKSRVDRSVDSATRYRNERGDAPDSRTRPRINRNAPDQVGERSSSDPARMETGRPSRSQTPTRNGEDERLSGSDDRSRVIRRPENDSRQAEMMNRNRRPSATEEGQRLRVERAQEQTQMNREMRRPERTQRWEQPQRAEQPQRVEQYQRREQPQRMAQPSRQRSQSQQAAEQPVELPREQRGRPRR